MLLRASRAARPLSAASARPLRGALAPAQLVTARPLRERQPIREQSSKAALAKISMGELGVDRMAGNSTVQGVEYVLTGLDRLVNWARKTSMWPMTFGLA